MQPLGEYGPAADDDPALDLAPTVGGGRRGGNPPALNVPPLAKSRYDVPGLPFGAA
ncbi:MAG TPA: hypothetical protein VGG78_04565 [Gemmatimonadaceae bacterium]